MKSTQMIKRAKANLALCYKLLALFKVITLFTLHKLLTLFTLFTLFSLFTLLTLLYWAVLGITGLYLAAMGTTRL